MSQEERRSACYPCGSAILVLGFNSLCGTPYSSTLRIVGFDSYGMQTAGLSDLSVRLNMVLGYYTVKDTDLTVNQVFRLGRSVTYMTHQNMMV
jgi:hypothetical protein